MNIADNFGNMAYTYHPRGSVERVDAFTARRCTMLGENRQTWAREHLMEWQDFSRGKIGLWDHEGNDADMLSPMYVRGFADRLGAAFEARGI